MGGEKIKAKRNARLTRSRKTSVENKKVANTAK